jgi:hypothetical protein
MTRYEYRCSASAAEIQSAPAQIFLEFPEGLIPPPTIDMHRPGLGTIVYYALGMYAAKDLARP